MCLESIRYAAQTAYSQISRGAITVDTTVHTPDMGHPFYHFTQKQLQELNDADVLRMVASLLKNQERVSHYHIGVPGRSEQKRQRSSDIAAE